MKHKVYLVLLVWFTSYSLCFGLTPTERKIIIHAKEHLGLAKQENIQAWDEANKAYNKAHEAEQRAAETDKQIDITKGQIKVAHDNEKRLGGLVAKYEPFWIQGHKWWGIGAIGLGVGILVKHLFVTIAVVLLLIVAGLVLAFFFPFLIPLFRMIGNFFGMLFRWIGGMFNRR
jgi:hypothetical protein